MWWLLLYSEYIRADNGSYYQFDFFILYFCVACTYACSMCVLEKNNSDMKAKCDFLELTEKSGNFKEASRKSACQTSNK